MHTIHAFVAAPRGSTSIRAFGVTTVRALGAALAVPAGWMDRARQRRALQALDDRLLKDVGLSCADVERETAKPFWRP